MCRLEVCSLLYGQKLPHFHCLAGSWALLGPSHPKWVNTNSARLLARKQCCWFGHKEIPELSALYIFHGSAVVRDEGHTQSMQNPSCVFCSPASWSHLLVVLSAPSFWQGMHLQFLQSVIEWVGKSSSVACAVPSNLQRRWHWHLLHISRWKGTREIKHLSHTDLKQAPSQISLYLVLRLMTCTVKSFLKKWGKLMVKLEQFLLLEFKAELLSVFY